jgi:hypothetical protein
MHGPDAHESKEPSSAVTECAASSLFVHVTVSPAVIVTDGGSNA